MNPFTPYPALTPAAGPATPASAAAQKKHKELVATTQKWVAQSFYGTLLKQMRQDPFKSDMLDGGRGGQVFTELFDQHLSERMTRGAPNTLVKSIVHKIEHGKASANYLQNSIRPKVDTSTLQEGRLHDQSHAQSHD